MAPPEEFGLLPGRLVRFSTKEPPSIVTVEKLISNAPPRLPDELPCQSLCTKVASLPARTRTAPPPVVRPVAELLRKWQSTKRASAALRVTAPPSPSVVVTPFWNVSPWKVTRLPRERLPFLKRRIGPFPLPSRITAAPSLGRMVNALP